MERVRPEKPNCRRPGRSRCRGRAFVAKPLDTRRRGRVGSICVGAILLSFSLLLANSPAAARNLFRWTISSGGETARQDTNSVLDVPKLFEESEILALFPGFTEDDDFVADLDLRGLAGTLDWDGTNQVLTLQIQGVQTIRFDAASLDENLDQMKSWFKGEFTSEGASQNLLSKLLQEIVDKSPVEPVAGNPNSLMWKMTGFDYRLAQEGPFLASEHPLGAPDQTGIAFDAGYAHSSGYDVYSQDLHIDHRFNFSRLPRFSLLVSLPIGVTWTSQQWTAMASLGLGAQVRVSERWAITAAGRFGVVGSLDVGAAAMLYSVGLTSHAEWPLDEFLPRLQGFDLGMTNQFALARSADNVDIGGYDLDYDLTNYVLRNGLFLRHALSDDTDWSWKLSGTQIQWFGNAFYVESAAELGLGLVHRTSTEGFAYDDVDLSLFYEGDFGRYDGIQLRMRKRF